MAILQFKLPLVDFSKLEEQGLVPGTLEWINVRDQVKLALQEVGSFEAVFGEIVPIGVRDSMIGVIQDAFGLPLESRRAGFDDLCDEIYRRYLREANQFYGSFGVNDTASDVGVERLCKWLWPEGAPPRSRGIIQLYAEKLSRADQLIRSWRASVARNTGMSISIRHTITSVGTSMKRLGRPTASFY
ncbi:hypothetical protein MLD38_019235 [Melastoma candidum]|uniref:Uncharacterized protein n=1 Tax=Melastoma candidum TaxID=119954 RepID=A0ACB9QWJ3_9MYRT|nr:hypothetical protein MLD38_019235 [Melastoma candidum]